MYEVFLTGGKLDGKKFKEFSNFPDAFEYSQELEKAYKKQFDPICGGVAILEIDKNGNKKTFDF